MLHKPEADCQTGASKFVGGLTHGAASSGHHVRLQTETLPNKLCLRKSHVLTLRSFMQYYDDTAGILRSVILSAIAPHRMAASPMPLSRPDNSAGPTVLPMASPLEEPLFSAFEDDVEDA